jgi:hypothetical protein
MNKIHSLVRKTHEILAEIASDLGEIYHDAAIVSYLSDMEDVRYREGVDEPEELQAHLVAVTVSAASMQKYLIALQSCFLSHNLQLDVSKAVERVEEIIQLTTAVNSHKDVNELILPGNKLMEIVDKLRRKIQEIILETGTAAEKVTPIDFSYSALSEINYDDIKRHPQASTQLAFSHFETHLRNRIKAKPDLFGEGLINAAYANNGAITFGETSAEQIGTRNFISGAYAVFRNPRMHRIVADDEQFALSIIALVDMMIRIVEQSENTVEQK